VNFISSHRIHADRMPSIIPCRSDPVSECGPVCLEPFEKRLWDVDLLGLDDGLDSVQNSLDAPIRQIFGDGPLSPGLVC